MASNQSARKHGIVFTHRNVPKKNAQIRTEVFVSRHNTSLNVTPSEIKTVFTDYGIAVSDIRQTGQHICVRDCPFCHDTKGEANNQFKLNVKIGDGCYYCFRCGVKGSWYDLKMKLGGYEVSSTSTISGMTETQPRKKYSYGSRGGNGEYDGSGGGSLGKGTKRLENNAQKGKVTTLPMPEQFLQDAYSKSLLDRFPVKGSQDDTPQMNETLKYLLDVRKLELKTLQKYGVGRGMYAFPSNNGYEEAECVTFPWFMKAHMIQIQEELSKSKNSLSKILDDDNLISAATKQAPYILRRIKARSIVNKGWQRLDPPGGGWGFFGYHTIPDDATEVVITEGEYDAMAVYQATKMPAISLPNGCRNLPIDLLPLLERFDKIYLWMDNDVPGREGAEKFAHKIGIRRCYLVNRPCVEEGKQAPKDANEALIKGIDLQSMLKGAEILRHEFVLTFKDLRSQVMNEIYNPDKYTGVPVKSLPGFTNIFKGFRRGEVTVLTGPTGAGKTTFLGQISLDMCEAGVNTLWGSFEIKNTRLLHKLLQQFGRLPLPTSGDPNVVEKMEALADRFECLPMYFMKFHGGSDIGDVLNAMEYAVYVHDVEHIILDNMQFMISRENNNSSFDKFEVQDRAIEKFRKFATEKNVHLTLVVHPRKEVEGSKLSMASFFGSAKATQEADTVMILQSDGKNKCIEIKKNRFDGTIGSSPLFFHHESGRYVETQESGGSEEAPGPRGGSMNIQNAAKSKGDSAGAWSQFE